MCYTSDRFNHSKKTYEGVRRNEKSADETGKM